MSKVKKLKTIWEMSPREIRALEIKPLGYTAKGEQQYLCNSCMGTGKCHICNGNGATDFQVQSDLKDKCLKRLSNNFDGIKRKRALLIVNIARGTFMKEYEGESLKQLQEIAESFAYRFVEGNVRRSLSTKQRKIVRGYALENGLT